MSMETILILSARLYKTAASLALFSSLFASAHGIVSSIYLLVLEMAFQISVSAVLNCKRSAVPQPFEVYPSQSL